MKYPVISWLHRVNISSSNTLVSTTTSLAWTNDNQNISSHKWQLEHIFILPNSTRPSKVRKNPTILHNLSWNNLFAQVDSSVKYLTADWPTGSTFVGVYVRCKQYECTSNLRQTASKYINTHRLSVFHVLWPTRHLWTRWQQVRVGRDTTVARHVRPGTQVLSLSKVAWREELIWKISIPAG